MEPITGPSRLFVAPAVATRHSDNSYTPTLHTNTDVELTCWKPSYSEDPPHPLANRDAGNYSQELIEKVISTFREE